MKALSNRIAGVAPSATIEISDIAKKMIREGIDVISLSIGEPDFDTPQHIKDACIEALRRGETHYVPSSGIPELVQAIAEKIRRENGFDCTPSQVIATCGAKHAIYLAMQAVLNPKDEVILIDPAWVSYEPCVQMAGGRVVHFPMNPRTFQVDDSIQDRITPRTKMILLNSPSNPAGTVMERHSLQLVADLCEDYDLFALSDEIYEKLVYGREHISFASVGDMAQRTITVNGFSKSFAMTGWRLGYAVAPPEVTRQMLTVQQHSVTHPTSFAMWGGVAALRGDQDTVEMMRREFDERRTYLLEALRGMGYAVAPADGAFYAFIDVKGDDVAVARHWLMQGHVAVTPGTAFYAPGWVRLSYATALPYLKEAVRRIYLLRTGSS
ncbi:MAG: pyridoxal phosphate-dependent aminotransferase [Methanomicrobiales archaeon]|nr:pyridoxal phosphate-dependent aminotransferase [Methanomicrobiales archaeon]